MFSNKLALFALAAVGTSAVPTTLSPRPGGAPLTSRAVTPNSEGESDGFFYSMWSDGTGDVNFQNGAAGQYSLTWQNSGDVVVGKGFKTGAPRNISYQADYEPQGISFLSVYGWLEDPLTEYYIVEDYGSGSPAGGDGMIHKGSLESDGSTYDVYQHQQVNAPSIQGTTNFMQYWSIRKDVRQSGTINTANHFDYWKSIGLPFGSFHYQILATEGVRSSGKSTVTVSEGASDTGSDAGSDSPSTSTSAPVVAVSSAPSAAPSAAAAPAPVAAPAAPAPAPVQAPSSTTPDDESSEADSDADAPSDVPQAPSTSDEPEPSSVISLPNISLPNAGTAGLSTPTGAYPGFGGQTPGAGFGGFGGYPRASPTPHAGHRGHRHGHWGNGAYPGGAPNAAGANGAPAASASVVSAAAASEQSGTGDDCQH